MHRWLSSFLFFLLIPFLMMADEYTFSGLVDGKMGYSTWSKNQKLPNISLYEECNDDGCFFIIENEVRERIGQLSEGIPARILAKSRFKSSAYALIQERHFSARGKRYKYYIANNKGELTKIDYKYSRSTLDVAFDSKGHLIQITPKGLYIDGRLKLKAQGQLLHGQIGHDAIGNIVAVAVDSDGLLKVSNFKKKLTTNTYFSKSRSYKNMAIIPSGQNEMDLVFYQKTKESNGLKLLHINFHDDTIDEGWLIRSNEREIGIEPELLLTDEDLIVTAKYMPSRTSFHMVINQNFINEVFDNSRDLELTASEQSESAREYRIQLGARLLDWRAKGVVKADIGVTQSSNSNIFSGEKRLPVDALYNYQIETEKSDLVWGFKGYSDLSEAASQGISEGKNDFLTLYMRLEDWEGLEFFTTSHVIQSKIVTHNDEKKEYERNYKEYGFMFNQKSGLYGGLSYVSSGETEVIALHTLSSNESPRGDVGVIDSTSHKSYYMVLVGYDSERSIRLLEEDYSGLLYALHLKGGQGEVSSKSDEIAPTIDPSELLVVSTTLRLGYIYHKWQNDPKGGFNLTLGLESNYEYMEATATEKLDIYTPRLRKDEILSNLFINLEFLY
jgi:hypothetical protein